MAYYAWAPIDYGAEKDEQGNIQSRKVIGLGEEVDQGKIEATDAEWAYFVNTGVVREQKYPSDIDPNSPNMESPNVVLARKARAQLEGATSQELGTFVSP